MFKTQPYKHQLEGFSLSKDSPYFAYFCDPGTGKTKLALDTASHLFLEKKINAILITTLNGVMDGWLSKEPKTHMHEYGQVYQVITSPKKQLTKFLASKEKLKILVTNIDLFSRSKDKIQFVEKFLKTHKVLWILDESTRIKHPKTKRTKTILKLSKLTDYKRILTGTPITTGYENLYSQFNFLSPSILNIKSFTAFKYRYCILGGFENRQIIGYQNTDELMGKIKPYVFLAKKENCLDLPPKVYQTYNVELIGEQKKAYQALKNNFIVELFNSTITAALAVTRIMKLQQIISGFIIDENGQVQKLPSEKITAVKELISTDRKYIVWCRFINEIKTLEEELIEFSPVTYYGELTMEERLNNLNKFLKDPDCKIFIANPSVGGTGLDGLQNVCDSVIYYSNSFNAEERWQSEDRVHRIGQKNSVTYIDLVCKNTVDEKIVLALQSKKNIATTLVTNKQFINFIS